MLLTSWHVEDLFSLFGKTDLLPFVYVNPHLIMVRDVTALMESQVAEYTLAREIHHKMGVDEYAHQKALGIGVGGAPLEQCQKWGYDKYRRQVDLGIGIGGASKEQCQK